MLKCILQGKDMTQEQVQRQVNYKWILMVLRLSPCLECSLCSFGNFPGVWSLKADVSELNVGSIVLGDQE